MNFALKVFLICCESLLTKTLFLLIDFKALTCYCDGSCPGNTQNGTCEVRYGGQCFSAVEEVIDDISGQIEPEYSFGCLSPDQAGGLLQVKQDAKLRIKK